jgi:hypothetical protein
MSAFIDSVSNALTRLRPVLVHGLLWLASPVARVGFFLLAMGLSAGLLYFYVWQPLRADIPLPPGIAPANPKLSIELLQSINAQRVERTQRARQQFAVGAIFQVASPPLP